MSLGCMLFKQNTHWKYPLEGHCHHRWNTVQGRQVSVLSDTRDWNKKQRKHFLQSGKEKALQPSIQDCRRTRKGEKIKTNKKNQTCDFLTRDFRLFLILNSQSSTDFIISFLYLYQYDWICYKLTKHGAASALHFHLGNSVSWFLPFRMYQLYGCVWVT